MSAQHTKKLLRIAETADSLEAQVNAGNALTNDDARKLLDLVTEAMMICNDIAHQSNEVTADSIETSKYYKNLSLHYAARARDAAQVAQLVIEPSSNELPV